MGARPEEIISVILETLYGTLCFQYEKYMLENFYWKHYVGLYISQKIEIWTPISDPHSLPRASKIDPGAAPKGGHRRLPTLILGMCVSVCECVCVCVCVCTMYTQM